MYASLLTLDQSTLFYRTLSNFYTGDNREPSDGIREWRSGVSKSKPTSRVANSLTSRARSTTPSVMSNAGRSSAPSVLTDNIKIISRSQASESTKVNLEPASTIGFNENGGLSDNDETIGEEREAAFASPFKGKKRLTCEVRKYLYLIRRSNCHGQQLVVQKPSNTTARTSKRPRNGDLPGWIDGHWFRRTFVSTYMAFVGRTANPWDVPPEQAVLVMQKIWDATTHHNYEITVSTPVYSKVSGRLTSRINNIIVHFRRFNAFRTRGAMLLRPLASQLSWHFAIHNLI